MDSLLDAGSWSGWPLRPHCPPAAAPLAPLTGGVATRRREESSVDCGLSFQLVIISDDPHVYPHSSHNVSVSKAVCWPHNRLRPTEHHRRPPLLPVGSWAVEVPGG